MPIMRKRNQLALLMSVLVLSLLVSACQGAGTSAFSFTETPAPDAEQYSTTETRTPAETASPQDSATRESPSDTDLSPAGQDVPVGCTVVSQQPTPGPTERSVFPPPTEEDFTRGPSDAYVTFTEYADFQCPACSQMQPVIERLLEEFPEEVQFVYRDFPLMSIHDKAALASQASWAAAEQGMYWELHNLLFEQQQEWASLSMEEFTEWVNERAEELELDVEQFEGDMLRDEFAQDAEAAWNAGVQIGIPGTPFLLINGRIYDGPKNFANLEAITRLILLEQDQFNVCPEMTIDPSKEYYASIETEKGDIVIELLPEQAPMAVNNFVFLSRQDWYDGVTFHRVLPGFVAQAGDPSGTGFGGPGYHFGNETSSETIFDKAGIVAMANAGPDTNGSQFFITMGPAEQLNGGYTIFGRVVEGMDVVEDLNPRDPAQNPGLPPGDVILNITIDEI